MSHSPEPSPGPDPDARTLLAATAVLAVASLLWLPLVGVGSAGATPVWAQLLLIAGLFAGESTRLHVERRGQAYAVSLGDIPLVVGAFLLAPSVLLAGWVSAAVTVTLVRRLPPARILFNAALFAAQAALLVHLLRLAAGPAPAAGDPGSWLGVYGGIAAIGVFSSLVVGTTMAFAQGRRLDLDAWQAMLLATLGPGLISATVALVVVLVVESDPVGTVLLLGLLVAFSAAYSSYSRLLRRRAALERFNLLSRRMHDSDDPEDLVRTALQETAELFRGSRATAWLTNAEGGGLEVVSVLRTATGDWTHGEREGGRPRPAAPAGLRGGRTSGAAGPRGLRRRRRLAR